MAGYVVALSGCGMSRPGAPGGGFSPEDASGKGRLPDRVHAATPQLLEVDGLVARYGAAGFEGLAVRAAVGLAPPGGSSIAPEPRELLRAPVPSVSIGDAAGNPCTPVPGGGAPMGRGERGWRGLWTGPRNASVLLVERLAVERRDDGRWFVRRIEVEGLGPGLEGVVRLPTTAVDGRPLEIELHGARVRPRLGERILEIPLARDEELHLAVRVDGLAKES